jgi:hypothetical protein
MTTVTGIICPNCADLVYSCARHDCNDCSCGDVFIDGGTEYTRVGFKDALPKSYVFEVDATKEELYNDWNKGPITMARKFGRLAKGQYENIVELTPLTRESPQG